MSSIENQSRSEAVVSKKTRKVGIVSHSRMRKCDGGDYEVRLYLVDIDEQSRVAGGGDMVKEFSPIDPAVRFRFPNQLSNFAVCVVDLTVYIFGGYKSNICSPVDTTKASARKFVLSDEVLGQKDYQVKEDQLAEISIMHHIKGIPVAIPTPMGVSTSTILVFGTYFRANESAHAFELYDIRSDSWEEFPEIPWTSHSRNDDKFVKVKCYSFTSERHFFLATNKGTFSLDITLRKWTNLDRLYLRMPDGYFVTAKGRCAFTARGEAYNFGINGWSLSEAAEHGRDVGVGPSFELSKFYPSTDSPAWLQQVFPYPSIIPLNPGEGEAEDGEVCNTLLLQMHASMSGWHARLLIDVCQTELNTLNTTVSKCVSLDLELIGVLRQIYMISV